MKRTSINFIIDSIAFVAFVLLTTTGILMKYILPPGSGHHTTIWSMDRHAWGDIHLWISVVFFSIIALHVVLHWRWIVNVFARVKNQTRESGYRAMLGLIGIISILAIAISPLVSPIEKQPTTSDSIGNQHKSEVIIEGSMTLNEIESQSGVPIRHIIEELKLPTSTSPNSKLGNLKKAHGFTMDEVRHIVGEYKDS